MSRKRSRSKRSRTEGSRWTALPGWLRVALPAVALIVAVGGVWLLTRSNDTGRVEAQVELAPASLLSPEIRQAPPTIQEAYRFAVANPDILSQIPCYCGCVNVGHESNLDCFVEAFNPDGSVAAFSDHGYG